MSLKTYRFALYGYSGSGKTALLAALAMSHIMNPKGYTSSWLPACGNQDGQKTSDIEKKRQVALANGKVWLDEAIDRLIKQDVPPPNPDDDRDMIFDYDFTTPQRRVYRIRLFDYAGELIDPSISTTKNAERLRRKLKGMDGLLVLAPAPYPNADYEILADDLRRLQESFMMLRGESQKNAPIDLPVALLVNAWDRRGGIKPGSPDQEVERLETFMTMVPPPPHRNLQEAIVASVSEGNFRAFPLSSFGDCEKITISEGRKIERPKLIRPLQSLSLEDPFIWVAQRCDEINLRSYEKEIAAISMLSGLLPWPLPVLNLRRAGTSLVERFLPETPEAVRASTGARKASWLFKLRFTALVIMFSLFLLGSDALFDHNQYRNFQNVTTMPSVSEEQLEHVEKWLEVYLQAPPFRHIVANATFLSKAHAKTELETFRSSRDDRFWAKARLATSTTDISAVTSYLKIFPNGRNSTEAQSIIRQFKDQNDDEAWRLIIDHPAGDGQAQKILKYLEAFPNGLHAGEAATLKAKLDAAIDNEAWRLTADYPAGDGQLKKVMEYIEDFPNGLHTGDAAKLKAKLDAATEWKAFVDEYKANMENGNFLAAGNMLSGRQADTPELIALQQEFRTQAVNMLEDKVKQALKSNLFDDGYKLLSGYTQWPSDLKTDEGANTVKRLEHDINLALDQGLYGKVTQNRTKEVCEEYLRTAPLKSMENAVQKYHDYLSQRDGEITFTPSLQIQWGDVPLTARKDQCKVTLWLNTLKTCEKIIECKSEGHVSVDQGNDFKSLMNAKVKVSAELEGTSYLLNKKINLGKTPGASEYNLKDLESGVELKATTSETDGKPKKEHTVMVKLDSGLPEPQLPTWKE